MTLDDALIPMDQLPGILGVSYRTVKRRFASTEKLEHRGGKAIRWADVVAEFRIRN